MVSWWLGSCDLIILSSSLLVYPVPNKHSRYQRCMTHRSFKPFLFLQRIMHTHSTLNKWKKSQFQFYRASEQNNYRQECATENLHSWLAATRYKHWAVIGLKPRLPRLQRVRKITETETHWVNSWTKKKQLIWFFSSINCIQVKKLSLIHLIPSLCIKSKSFLLSLYQKSSHTLVIQSRHVGDVSKMFLSSLFWCDNAWSGGNLLVDYIGCEDIIEVLITQICWAVPEIQK